MVTLVSHFTNMLKLDSPDIRTEAQAAEALGIHPFRAKKAMTQLAKIGPQAAADAVVLLAQADLDLRGASSLRADGVDDGVLVLEILVARLCRLARTAGHRR
jgi:DNA polymerase-3 subunit delta